MGEYYLFANVDRKEYLEPVDFNIGPRAGNSMCRESEILKALYELLESDWKDEHIIYIGDESFLNKSEENPILNKLYEQTLEFGYPGDTSGLIHDTYRNVSCLFKDAEEEVRKEIDICLLYPDDTCSKLIKNAYRFDMENPYEGMFQRKGKIFKYLINYTKKVCYSFEKTTIRFQNRETTLDYDPLPQLIGFGRNIDGGQWLGDVVGVANAKPDDVILLEELVLYW